MIANAILMTIFIGTCLFLISEGINKQLQKNLDREKELNQMLQTIYRAGVMSETYNKLVAKVLIDAGYRKANEVRKETAKEILQAMNEKMNMLTGCGVPYHVKQFMEEIAKKYGVEVDE